MMKSVMEDIEKCVRCGSCKAVCPTHGRAGVEPLGARGRMVLLHEYLKGSLKPGALLNDRLYSCTLCGLCEAACPAGVKVTEAVCHGRNALRQSDKKRRLIRTAAKLSVKNPELSFRTLKLALALSGGIIPRLLERARIPFGVSLPREPLRGGPRIFKPRKSRGRVAVFAGCSVNYLNPDLGKSLIAVLLAAGYEAVLPPGEVCCGEPLRALGLEDDALRLARRNLDVFGKLRADAVVSPCPTCTLSLRVHYASLLGRAVENAMDITEFLHGGIVPVEPPRERAVAYHNPCHLYGLGVRSQPVEVLRSLGYDASAPDGPSCCGFSVSLWDGEMSSRLLDEAVGRLGDAGTVVTACPGCMMQLGRRHPNVKHIVELIEAGTIGAIAKETEAA